MASAKNNRLISSQGPHFSPRSTAKTNGKSTNSGRMASIGISDVVTASRKSRETRDELSTISAPDATSLHHCLQNHRQYYTILN